MSQRTISSQGVSQSDITLFKAVTEVDDDTARTILSKHPNLNSALDAYLSISRQPLTNLPSSSINQKGKAQQSTRSSYHSSPKPYSNNEVSGSQKGLSQTSKSKLVNSQSYGERDSEDSMNIEDEGGRRRKVLKENSSSQNASKNSIRSADVFAFFKEITQEPEELDLRPQPRYSENKKAIFPKEREQQKKSPVNTMMKRYSNYELSPKASDFGSEEEEEEEEKESGKLEDEEEQEEEEEDRYQMEVKKGKEKYKNKVEVEENREENDEMEIESQKEEQEQEQEQDEQATLEVDHTLEEEFLENKRIDQMEEETETETVQIIDSKENSSNLLSLFTKEETKPQSRFNFRENGERRKKEEEEKPKFVQQKLPPPLSQQSHTKPSTAAPMKQINWGLPKLPYLLKDSYEDYIKPFQKKQAPGKNSFGRPGSKKQEEAPEEGWPKYLGSLLVECRFASEEYVGRINIHDQITLEADTIKFSSTNVTNRKKATKEEGKVKVKKQWHIKGNSLIVRCYWKGNYIGNLRCYNEEIFVFLLSKGFVLLEGIVLDIIKDQNKDQEDIEARKLNPEEGQEPGQKLKDLFSRMKIPSKMKLQLNIFLLSQILKDPLNINIGASGKKSISKTKSKIGDYTYEKEVEDDESQKDFQILRFTKESLSRLFSMLNVRITIPTSVQVRYRFDPFKRLTKDKVSINQFSAFGADISSGVMPDLIMSTIPDYYRRADEIKMSYLPLEGFQPASKLLPEKKDKEKAPLYEHIIEDDDDDDEDEDEDGMSLEEDGSGGRRTPNKFSQANYKYRSSGKSSDEDEHPGYGEEKVNTDLLSTSEQFSNHYILTDPPYTFKSELHVFQKQALSWMRHKEGLMELKDLYDESLQEGRVLSDLFQEMILPDGTKMYFNPFNGEISAEFPKMKSCKGGILADEMGLGKTVMTIALIHSHRRKITEMEEEIIEDSSEDEFGAFKIPKADPNLKKKDVLDMLGLRESLPKGGRGSKAKNSSNNKSFVEDNKTSGRSKSKGKVETRNTRKATTKKVKRDDSSDGSWFGDEKEGKGKGKGGGGDDNWQPEDFDSIRKETGIKRKDSFDLMGFGTADTNKGGTLVVVPLTVLSQWETEIVRHSKKGTLSVLQYYGNNRKKTRLSDYDVVLTTYGLLESEYSKQKEEASGLFKCEWFRVILDEAHYIKGRTTKTAKASFALNAEYRWCLTGTPIQNKLDDLFALLQFLKVETWGEYLWWNTYVNNFGSIEEASKLVRGVLKQILLRRTKKSTYSDGRNILQLPKKEIRSLVVKLTQDERRIYNCFFQGSQDQFHQMVQGGTLTYEYAHIFELLIRLRQVCDHPCLVFSREDMQDQFSIESAVLNFLQKKTQNQVFNNKSKQTKGKGKSTKGKKDEIEEETDKESSRPEFINNILKSLKGKDLEPCSVCLEEILEPVITNCGHIFCERCLTQSITNYKKCPLCKTELSIKDMMSISLQDTSASRALVDVNDKNFKKSSKLEALLNAVGEVAKKREKCVIFSQFIGMLNLIGRFLEEKGLVFRRIDGAVTMKQRMMAIEDFKKNNQVTAFLISLRAGGVGLNLTAANHVFVVDPWWNPAVEDQAIERIYRIGQQRDVFVTRFICGKTIEERILELQEKKKNLINMTLHFNPEEQKKQNIENMKHVMKGFDEEDE